MLNSAQDPDVNPTHPVVRSPSLQYLPIVTELSIEQSKAMPIFTEATALAVRLTAAPVAILTVIGKSGCQIVSIVGLEQFARLPTQPNLLLELAGLEYCHARVITNESSFSVNNFQKHPQLAQSSLYRVHGIQAYLGLPIVTAAKDRLGTIAILDFKPRQFSDLDIDLLQLVSRLVASEFERKLLSQAQLNHLIGDLRYPAIQGFDDALAVAEHVDAVAKLSGDIQVDAKLSSISLSHEAAQENSIRSPRDYPLLVHAQLQGEIQSKLLTHLAQELLTPLTSVLGMSSVLQQEIYGSLSSKQKDYLGIIHHSGQQLVTIVDEITQLGGFDASGESQPQQSQPNIKSVDLIMLCQLAIQSLEPLAQKKQQQIRLDLAGGDSLSATLIERMCLLDKDKVRQIVYYLCLSLIHASTVDRQISIQFSNLADGLQLQITTNDPQVILRQQYLPDNLAPIVETTEPLDSIMAAPTELNIGQDLHISLGLSLSHILAAAHGGNIEIITNGQGYQLILPLAAQI